MDTRIESAAYQLADGMEAVNKELDEALVKIKKLLDSGEDYPTELTEVHDLIGPAAYAMEEHLINFHNTRRLMHKILGKYARV